MSDSFDMNDVQLHLGQRKTPLCKIASSTDKVQYWAENNVIRSNCKVGAFKV